MTSPENSNLPSFSGNFFTQTMKVVNISARQFELWLAALKLVRTLFLVLPASF